MDGSSLAQFTTQIHLQGQVVIKNNLENQIEGFWKTVEITDKKQFSLEEIQCEEYFKTTTTRNNTIRRRLQLLEKRLNKDPELKTRYHQFMEEYQTMGHMSEIQNNNKDDKVFYLPQH